MVDTRYIKKMNKGICFELFSSGVGFCLFGSTGDLSKKKIIPALCNLYLKEFVRENFFVLNVGSKDYNDETFRKYIASILDEKGIKDYQSFLLRNYYFKIDYTSIQSFLQLSHRFSKLIEEYKSTNKIFYLSIIPSEIKNTLKKLYDSGCFSDNFRIILEKPYGSDFKNSCDVAKFLSKNEIEENTYRIDHYIAKDGVINILLLRLLNLVFEKTFNNKFVDNVQITLYEAEGVEDRIRYFESVGLFMDMFSHLVQIVSFLTMNLPNDLKPDAIRSKKKDVLKYLSIDLKNLIRARYASYNKLSGIEKNSKTETFVAFKLFVNYPKWKGIPFYIRIGKKMKEKISRVDIVYKKKISQFSKRYGISPSNVFTFIIQPENRIDFQFIGKVSGPKFCVSEKILSADMSNKSFLSVTDYERLILDCINGDKTLFLDIDEVIQIWKHMHKYIKSKDQFELLDYPDGEEPKIVKQFILKDNREWIYS